MLKLSWLQMWNVWKVSCMVGGFRQPTIKWLRIGVWFTVIRKSWGWGMVWNLKGVLFWIFQILFRIVFLFDASFNECFQYSFAWMWKKYTPMFTASSESTRSVLLCCEVCVLNKLREHFILIAATLACTGDNICVLQGTIVLWAFMIVLIPYLLWSSVNYGM